MFKLNFQTNFNKILLFGSVFLLITFIIVLSIQKMGGDDKIWVEAEDALSIKAPIEIVKMEGASGDKGIFSENTLSKGTGYAIYKIEINNPGEYLFWGRVFWPDVCSNSFKIEINNDSKTNFGNDPIINQWLWVGTGLEPSLQKLFSLQKGVNEIKIYNNESGAKLDKFLLTTDRGFIPKDMGLSSDIYLKFDKNGKLPSTINFNNKENWKIDSVKWCKGYDYALNMKELINSRTGSFKLDVSKISNFIFGFNYKILKEKFFKLKLTSDKKNIIFDFSANEVKILIQSHNNQKKLLYTAIMNSNKDGFNQLCIDKNESKIWIKIDEHMPFCYDDKTKYESIMVSSQTGGIYYDDITLTSNVIQKFNESFHGTHFTVKEDYLVVKKHYFDNFSSNNLHFLVNSGTWTAWNAQDFETLRGKVTNGSFAEIVMGTYLWKNYSFDVAFNIKEEKNFGIIFNYQNENNYYQCLFKKQDNIWRPELIKVSKGKIEIIAETTGCMFIPNIGFWEHFNVVNNNDSTTVSLNDKILFSVYDSILNCGKIGFVTESKIGCNFDNIMIEKITNSNHYPIQNSANYKFSFIDKLFMDLASWRPLDKNYVKVFQDSSANDAFKFVGLEKKIGENVFLSHRKLLESDFTICFKYYYFRRDIIPAFHFTCYKDHQTSKHSFLFENNQWIYKINSEIIGAHINRKKRLNNFNIKHKIDKWMIFSDEDTLSFSDLERKYDSIQFSFGYEGIGYAQIPFPQIEIQNLIEK